MQGVPAAHLQSLAAALHSTLAKLRREDLGLELAELEAAARLVIAEEEEGEGEVATLSEVFSHASLKNRVSDDSDDDSDSSSDSDSDDSSS